MYEYDDLRATDRLAGDWSRPADVAHVRRDRFREHLAEHQPLHAAEHAGDAPELDLWGSHPAGPSELATTSTPASHAPLHHPHHTPLHRPLHGSRWHEGKP